MSIGQRIQALADKQAIYGQMCRYIQACDRCDVDLLKSVFHQDGTVRFGIFDGNAIEFAEYDIPFIKDNLLMSWHRISNVTIELNGNRATAESYMLGNASASTPNGVINCPDGMRYTDIWEKREGMWRMSSRSLIMDWNAAWAYSGRTDGIYASFKELGERSRNDLSYRLGLVP